MKERLWISRLCSTDQAPQQEQDTAHTDELPEYATDIHEQQAIVQDLFIESQCFAFLRIVESQSNKEEIPHNEEETSEGSDVGKVVFEVEEEEDAYQGEREAENNEDRENDTRCVLVIDAVSIHMYVLIKTKLCAGLVKED